MAELVHDLAIAQARQGLHDLFVLGQSRPYLPKVPAFDQRQAVLHHFAALPQADQALRGQARSHAVFAAVQRLTIEVEAPVKT